MTKRQIAAQLRQEIAQIRSGDHLLAYKAADRLTELADKLDTEAARRESVAGVPWYLSMV